MLWGNSFSVWIFGPRSVTFLHKLKTTLYLTLTIWKYLSSNQFSNQNSYRALFLWCINQIFSTETHWSKQSSRVLASVGLTSFVSKVYPICESITYGSRREHSLRKLPRCWRRAWSRSGKSCGWSRPCRSRGKSRGRIWRRFRRPCGGPTSGRKSGRTEEIIRKIFIDIFIIMINYFWCSIMQHLEVALKMIMINCTMTTCMPGKSWRAAPHCIMMWTTVQQVLTFSSYKLTDRNFLMEGRKGTASWEENTLIYSQ